MAVKNNHVGETVGIYKIIELMPYKASDGHALYKGVCTVCGTERIAQYIDLKVITKCTHLRLGGIKTSRIVHWTNQRIARIFSSMKSRCYNVLNEDYKTYGGKGIKVCDEWLNNPLLFEKWSLDNGYTNTLTIDRIDSNKDYSPDNCRWVTLGDNAKYKSTTTTIEVNGIIHTGRDWSKELGLGINTINRYIRQYGLESTKEFIEKCIANPNFKEQITKGQSYYDLYMGH